MTKRVLSLFSGCGGMDLGFEGGFSVYKNSINPNTHGRYIENNVDDNYLKLKRTTFNTVFANDILSSAEAAWVNYFSKRNPDAHNIFHKTSIVDLVHKNKSGDFSFPENIDVVTGGFPCQDFSVAGKRKGFESLKDHNGEYYDDPTEATRGRLYLWLKEVVEITKPKLFIAENVKGLVSLGDVKNIIENDFRQTDKGYIVVNAKVLNAKNYGVPQNRERIIFIGISKRYARSIAIKSLLEDAEDSKYYPYPPQTHGTPEFPYVKLEDIFAGLPEPENSKDDSHKTYSKAKYYGKMQGGSEVNLLGQGPTIRSEHHGNIEFRRLSIENGGRNFEELNKKLPERRLSVRECAMIQSFPNDYEFVFNKGQYKINSSEGYKVIGNAVPPLLGFAISTHLEKIWEGIFGEK